MSDEFEKLAGTAPTLTLTPFPEKKEEKVLREYEYI